MFEHVDCAKKHMSSNIMFHFKLLKFSNFQKKKKKNQLHLINLRILLGVATFKSVWNSFFWNIGVYIVLHILLPKERQNSNVISKEQKKYFPEIYYTMGQFHVRDLFLGKLNSDDDFAERLLNPWFNSISRA